MPLKHCLITKLHKHSTLFLNTLFGAKKLVRCFIFSTAVCHCIVYSCLCVHLVLCPLFLWPQDSIIAATTTLESFSRLIITSTDASSLMVLAVLKDEIWVFNRGGIEN